MDNKKEINSFIDILNKQQCVSFTNNYFSLTHKRSSKNNTPYLTEEDFYPPFDNRVLKSYIEDIENGDNFADYCKYIFKLYEEEYYN